MGFQDWTTAERILILVDALSLHPRFYELLTLGGHLDPHMVRHGLEFTFTDRSQLRLDDSGHYYATSPEIRLWEAENEPF